MDTFPNVTNVGWLANFAMDQGYLKRNGVDAVPNEVNTAVLHLASITAGRADVTLMSLDVALPAMEKGVDLKLITGESSNLWQLWTTAGSPVGATFPKSIQDLKGKTVGVATLGSAGQIYMQRILAAAGMAPDSVKFVAYGSAIADAAAALKAGKVDAAMGNEILHYLLPNGGRKLLDFVPPPGPDFPKDLASSAGAPYIAWIGTAKFAQDNPTAVRGIQVGLAEASCYISNPAHHEEFTNWVGAHNGIPAAVPKTEWSNYVYNSIEQLAYFPTSVAQQSIADTLKSGAIKKSVSPSDFFVSNVPQSTAEANSLAKANGFTC